MQMCLTFSATVNLRRETEFMIVIPLLECFYRKKKICFANIRFHRRASLVDQMIKNLPAMRETWVWSLGWEDPLEKEMATHFSILAWRITWTQSLVGFSPCDCKQLDNTRQFTHTHTHTHTGSTVVVFFLRGRTLALMLLTLSQLAVG